jgi:hypothetical protein
MPVLLSQLIYGTFKFQINRGQALLQYFIEMVIVLGLSYTYELGYRNSVFSLAQLCLCLKCVAIIVP